MRDGDDATASFVMKVMNPDGGLHFGPTSLAMEVISSTLAVLLGLPVPRFAILDVDESLSAAIPSMPDLQALLRNNIGPNFGCERLENAFLWSYRGPPSDEDANLLGQILAFDLLMLNSDRHDPSNPNLIGTHKLPVCLVDHSLAMHGTNVTNHLESLAILDGVGVGLWFIKNHVVFHAIKGRGVSFRPTLDAWDRHVRAGLVSDLRSMVPVEWWKDAGHANQAARFLARRWRSLDEIENLLKAVTA